MVKGNRKEQQQNRHERYRRYLESTAALEEQMELLRFFMTSNAEEMEVFVDEYLQDILLLERLDALIERVDVILQKIRDQISH